MFDQKPVVAERRVDLVVGAVWKQVVERVHLRGGEDDVGRDPHDEALGRDALQGRFDASAPPSDVVRIEGVEDLVIGVGVVATAEFLALVLLVGAGTVLYGGLLRILLGKDR